MSHSSIIPPPAPPVERPPDPPPVPFGAQRRTQGQRTQQPPIRFEEKPPATQKFPPAVSQRWKGVRENNQTSAAAQANVATLPKELRIDTETPSKSRKENQLSAWINHGIKHVKVQLGNACSSAHEWIITNFRQFFNNADSHDKPPWLVSLTIHLVVLIILALISFRTDAPGDFVLTMKIGEQESKSDFTDLSIDTIDFESLDSFQTTEIEQPMEVDPFQPELDLSTVVPELEIAESAELIEMPSANSSPRDGSSMRELDLPSLFAGRSGAAKQRLLEIGGGNQETEDAVELGLAWLKRQQRSDGSWSLIGPYSTGARFENSTSATAMALLAFMGAGNTHQAGPYKTEVIRGIRWLVNRQDPSGWMAHDSMAQQGMYAQAQATIAVCELYAMTNDYWLRKYAQRACNFAAKAQSPQGGWRYQPRFDSDTSVTGWFLVGLKSGEAAGLEIDEKIFEDVSRYIDSVADERYSGGYSYQVGEPASPSMTAEALLCRQYLGWHRNMPGMRNGLATLVNNHPIEVTEPDVYYWYYAAQSIHHFGGPLWEQWNERMKTELPASQVKQGRERGSWNSTRDAWGQHAGRLYTTCMSLFCLEVYYRHMPIYDVWKK
ncbi:terpene cyclase/mutase family protein [Stieleria sp. JC731]|uniref:prenyltransferase/squalene oxidase repeat-containing protein n=1 Tax=Pirellulaceae TaxID=2691357 RepID=UPI001E366C66|nr:prenyltransferase/squalene oxidase repeat-containing protein [Stieleria sp. JC731]MCC9599530.1 terpene cyclase/mutase family protein [Stieleria sp. JC731]